VLNKGIKDMFVKIDWDSDDIGDVDELLVVESELESAKIEAIGEMEEEFEVILENN
tara:strand:- start:778 stop:945 length:168 start_codon:yes stop_codon:yes gene_type:complete